MNPKNWQLPLGILANAEKSSSTGPDFSSPFWNPSPCIPQCKRARMYQCAWHDYVAAPNSRWRMSEEIKWSRKKHKNIPKIVAYLLQKTIKKTKSNKVILKLFYWNNIIFYYWVSLAFYCYEEGFLEWNYFIILYQLISF